MIVKKGKLQKNVYLLYLIRSSVVEITDVPTTKNDLKFFGSVVCLVMSQRSSVSLLKIEYPCKNVCLKNYLKKSFP